MEAEDELTAELCEPDESENEDDCEDLETMIENSKPRKQEFNTEKKPAIGGSGHRALKGYTH